MKPLVRRLLLGLAAGVAAAVFSLLSVGELLDLRGYDLLHALRKPSSPPSDIVLVAIDEPSFAETRLQWPWPRGLHARLVDALSRSGASVIALDILFAEPSSPAQDTALAEAIRRAGNVVLASDLETSEHEGFGREMAVEPLELLRSHCRTGLAKVPLDPDNAVRRFYPRGKGERLFSEQIASLYTERPSPAPHGAYIYFPFPPGSLLHVSYYQALDPEQYLPPDFFRNKIVIVGKSVAAATGETSDYFATPFLLSKAPMSGAELQATMTYNFLEGRFVRRMPPQGRIALLLCLGVLASALQINWRPIRSAFLAAGAAFLYFLAVVVLFERFLFWAPTFPAVLALLIPYGYAGTEAYLSAERKRKEIRRIFGHYLSPSVLDSILASPEDLKLGGRRVEATILFADIAGFTSLSESMEPEEVSGMLNIYFTEMAREIFSEKGTIDKFIGDAVMAFWGAPLADEDHALHACRAAVAMQESLRRLAPRMRERGYPEIAARIGINTGLVVAGNMGSEDLYNYTVLGDSVNLASRLEGANKQYGTSIIISEYVYEEVRDRVEVRPLGRIRVHGKTRDVAVYELLSCGP